jgi:hypothetical protein
MQARVSLAIVSDEDIKTSGVFYSQCAAIRGETDHAHRAECGKKGEKAPMIDSVTVFNDCMVPYDKEREQLDRKCTKESEDYAVGALPRERLEAATVAFVPVPLGWGFTYLVLFLVRWVKRGFVRPR